MLKRITRVDFGTSTKRVSDDLEYGEQMADALLD